ncbi:unnamed protein product [Ixodes pacificus]
MRYTSRLFGSFLCTNKLNSARASALALHTCSNLPVPGTRLLAHTSKVVPQAATSDVAKAGVARCRMSRSWRSVLRVPTEKRTECERRCRRRVPTLGCRSFRAM